MFPFCITGHLLDTTALNTYPFILHILFSTYMMYKGCHSGSKQAFAFHFQFLCSSGPSVVCTVGAVEQLLALRFVLGINFDFRLETESLGSPCICEGPLYHFPLPRYFTRGNHSERGEVKVLTTLPIKVCSLSSERGGVPTALRPGIISARCGKAWRWMFSCNSCKLLAF